MRVAVLAGRSVAVGLLALTAACGGSGSDTSGTASSSASTSSSASGSASSSASSSASGDSGSTGTSASGLTRTDIFSRLIAAQKKAGSYTFVLTTDAGGGQALTGKGEADTSRTPPATHVKLGGPPQGIETIGIDGIYYLKGGPFGTAKWLKIDPKSATGLGAVMGQLGGSDPASSLAALQEAASVQKKGSVQVGGASTTEYDVTVPGSALAKNSPAAAQLKGLLPKQLVYRLFVGDGDLLRRLTTTFAIQGKTSTTSIDFTDYGSKVSITAPPASQVTDKPGG